MLGLPVRRHRLSSTVGGCW